MPVQIEPKPATAKGPADWFTGDVYMDPIARGEEPSRVRVMAVRFTPAARTAWHSHAVGQTLYVTEGRGLIQARDGEISEIRAGDIITTPSGEAHWHGAADAAATLAGSLDHADAGRYDISLQLTPANQSDPLLLALKLDGPGNHLDLRLPPLGMARWWSHIGDEEGPRLGVPPGSGQVDAATLDVAGVHVEGLRMTLTPAPASSASTPAAPASSGAR
jgi:quercetin dioxygenase-like cupin family protein